MAGLVIITVTVMVLWRAGLPQQAAHRALGTFWELTGRAGLSLAEVTVTGRKRTPDVQILTALGLWIGAPMLAIDLTEARARLEAIPTIRTAVVERRLPKTVHVVIIERSGDGRGNPGR